MRWRCTAAASPKCARTRPQRARQTLRMRRNSGPRSPKNSRSAASSPDDPRKPLALEEPHLDSGELHHVVVVQTTGLRSDGHAVDLRIIVFFAAVDVHDEVAFRA